MKFVEEYYRLLTEDYSGINLTRITDFEEFKIKQIDDSVEPYKQSKKFQDSLSTTGRMVDVGFGGGFPVLPLASELPGIQFNGIETRGKKVKVVMEMAEKLNLSNVNLFHNRIENVLIDVPVVITFKAVGKVGDFLNKINTNQILHIYFYKGPNFYTLESEQLDQVKKNWKIIEEKEIIVDSTVDKRYLIGFENKNVPCGTNNLNKLVKFSELI